MTAAPHTIESKASYADAGKFMHEHHIRHLPVMDGETLIGVVNEDDVALIAALKGLFPSSVSLGDFQGPPPYKVAPDVSLLQVANELILNKRSCAVVMDMGKVVGVFTLIDALRALVDLAAEQRRVPAVAPA